MKTGIKSTIIKPALQFPVKSIPYWRSIIRLYYQKTMQQQFIKQLGVADLLSYPHPISCKAWQIFTPLNPNNTGSWSNIQSQPYMESTSIEQQLFMQLADLYHVASEQVDGYVSSGSTEGNILACWLGRMELEKYTARDKIILVHNDLTHYSITKAASIVGVNTINSPINSNQFTFDLNSLIKTLKDIAQQNINGILLPLTIGYTVGLTQDAYQEIIKQIRIFKKQNEHIHFFIWLDAATSGLTQPFITDFQPFKYPEVQLLTTDFHKFWGVNYPAGFVIYRKHLVKLIQHDIPYINIKDTTLLGSRTGISPVAISTLINHLGFTKMQKIVRDAISRKMQFIAAVKDHDPSCQVITDPNDIGVAVIFTKRFATQFEAKYGIYPKKIQLLTTDGVKSLSFYKAFFLARYQ